MDLMIYLIIITFLERVILEPLLEKKRDGAEALTAFSNENNLFPKYK